MKTLLASLFFVLVATVSFSQDKVKKGPVAKFDELVYDYGTIKQGDKVSHEFRFTSVGTEPFIISQAQGSCGCTVPEFPKQPMSKGEKGTIKVTFDSAGKMGPQDKTVTVMSNMEGGPIVLHIKGTIEPSTPKNTPEARPMENPKN